VWRTDTGAVTGSWGSTGTISLTDTFHLHNIRISKNGQYVKVTQNSCVGGGCTSSRNTYIWNLATLTVTAIVNDGTLGCGHNAIGWVYTINLCSGFQIRVFSSNDQAGTDVAAGHYPSPNSNQDGHGSFQSGNNTDTNPVFWSRVPNSAPGAGLFAPTNGWDNEIQAIRMDGTGTVYRFAHTYTSYQTTDSFGAEQAIGSISLDGKFYMWATDWDGMLGQEGGGSSSCTLGTNCRSDVFIASLSSSGGGGGGGGTGTNMPAGVTIIGVTVH
jgi:hypothetical protein